jgi:hypothetical protein
MENRAPRPLSWTPLQRIEPGWWIPVVLLLVTLDYLTGPYVQLPAIYIVPVALAAWYSGTRVALFLAVLLPLTRLPLMLWAWGLPWSVINVFITAAVRVGTFTVTAITVARLADHERYQARRIHLLEGLLPVCAYCQSIRSDTGSWQSMREYIEGQIGDTFSHAVCPTCAKQHFPEYFEPTAQS